MCNGGTGVIISDGVWESAGSRNQSGCGEARDRIYARLRLHVERGEHLSLMRLIIASRMAVRPLTLMLILSLSPQQYRWCTNREHLNSRDMLRLAVTW
jgi:hypothetical protein